MCTFIEETGTNSSKSSQPLAFLCRTICGKATSKRPYGELGSVDRGNCCCCVGFSSAFGEIAPGCGELVSALMELQRHTNTADRLSDWKGWWYCSRAQGTDASARRYGPDSACRADFGAPRWNRSETCKFLDRELQLDETHYSWLERMSSWITSVSLRPRRFNVGLNKSWFVVLRCVVVKRLYVCHTVMCLIFRWKMFSMPRRYY